MRSIDPMGLVARPRGMLDRAGAKSGEWFNGEMS